MTSSSGLSLASAFRSRQASSPALAPGSAPMRLCLVFVPVVVDAALCSTPVSVPVGDDAGAGVVGCRTSDGLVC